MTEPRDDEEEEDAANPPAEPRPNEEAEAVEEETASAASDAPAPKKKKKRKKGKADAAPEDAPPAKLPGEGTPEGEKLLEANNAFASGNYARVRELATELQKATDPQVADAASALLRKVSADPVQLAFLGACAFAILVITWIYVIEPASH